MLSRRCESMFNCGTRACFHKQKCVFSAVRSIGGSTATQRRPPRRRPAPPRRIFDVAEGPTLHEAVPAPRHEIPSCFLRDLGVYSCPRNRSAPGMIFPRQDPQLRITGMDFWQIPGGTGMKRSHRIGLLAGLIVLVTATVAAAALYLSMKARPAAGLLGILPMRGDDPLERHVRRLQQTVSGLQFGPRIKGRRQGSDRLAGDVCGHVGQPPDSSLVPQVGPRKLPLGP